MTEPEPRPRSSAVPLTPTVAEAIEEVVAAPEPHPVGRLRRMPKAEREWVDQRWGWTWIGPVDGQPLPGVERPVVVYTGTCITRRAAQANLKRLDRAHRRMLAGRRPRPSWLPPWPTAWDWLLAAAILTLALYVGFMVTS